MLRLLVVQTAFFWLIHRSFCAVIIDGIGAGRLNKPLCFLNRLIPMSFLRSDFRYVEILKVGQFNCLLFFRGQGNWLVNCVDRLSLHKRGHFNLWFFKLLLRNKAFCVTEIGFVYLRVIYVTFLTKCIVVTLAKRAVNTLYAGLVLVRLMFKRFFTFTQLELSHSILDVVSDQLIFFAFILLFDSDGGFNLCIVQSGDFFFSLLFWNPLLFNFYFWRFLVVYQAENVFM